MTRHLPFTLAATSVLAMGLACGGGGDDFEFDLGDMDMPGAPAHVKAPGSGDIADIAKYKIWVKVASESPSIDYCGKLTEAGLTVECDLGWSVSDNEDNVMLKCGSLPDNTGDILVAYLGIQELGVWDWRKDEGYGMEYCSEMDAITLAIVTP